MVELVEKARSQGDSLGGIVQCFAVGIPAGIGDPVFGGGVPPGISAFAIPAVKESPLATALQPAGGKFRRTMILSA